MKGSFTEIPKNEIGILPDSLATPSEAWGIGSLRFYRTFIGECLHELRKYRQPYRNTTDLNVSNERPDVLCLTSSDATPCLLLEK